MGIFCVSIMVGDDLLVFLYSVDGCHLTNISLDCLPDELKQNKKIIQPEIITENYT